MILYPYLNYGQIVILRFKEDYCNILMESGVRIDESYFQ
jgi:hypothetical protein